MLIIGTFVVVIVVWVCLLTLPWVIFIVLQVHVD